MFSKIVREPIAHFLLVGGLLFGAWYNFAPRENGGSGAEIVIDQPRLDQLEMLWEAQWKRKPNSEEVAAIVDRYLRQELFFREALKMGLDKDDDIIRNRLSQKMEDVATDLGVLMEPPTDETLRAFYMERPDLFTLPDAYAFEQVLYKSSEATDAELAATVKALRAGGDISPDRANKYWIPADWELTAAPTLQNSFGGDFVASLKDLPLNEWSGPVKSGLGNHIVRLSEKRASEVAPYDDIQEYVKQQYEYYKTIDAQDEMFKTLLAKYKIRIEAEGVPETVVTKYSGS